MRFCNKNNNQVEPEIITKIEVKYDTLKTIKETYIPKWKTKIITKIDTFQQSIDTLAILQDYYTKYFYQDTIKIDTIGYVVLNDTITKNTIFSRDVKTNIIYSTTTITKEIYLNNREFYWGIGLHGRTNQLNYLGGELLYKNKKRNIYGFGLGINQDFQPILSGRIYWRIKK